jgi:hypothetical protein
MCLWSLWASLAFQAKQVYQGMQSIDDVARGGRLVQEGAGIDPIEMIPQDDRPTRQYDMMGTTKPLDQNYTAMLLGAWGELQYKNHVKIRHAIPRIASIDRDAITVAVHASTSKLNRLLFLIQRWGGPTSTSIYFQSEKDICHFANFYMEHADSFQHTDIHVMMEVTELEYPHNILREMALQSIDSDYFLALDVDFLTTPNASQSLYHLIGSDSALREQLQNRTLMVLPAFNRNLGTKVDENNVLKIGNKMLAKDKAEAMEQWELDKIEPFHLKRFKVGHGQTNFDKWYDFGEKDNTTESFYPIKYKPRFEPYILGYKRGVDLPHYWAGFRGFGYNKYTWFVEAHYMGFRYAVLKDQFVVHLDHKYTKRKANDRTDKQIEYFRLYMKMTYGLGKRELKALAPWA